MNAVVKTLISACRIGWLILLPVTGCTKPENAEALVGTYVADYKIATEKVILKGDGTFLQNVKIKSNGPTNTASGTWTYDSKRGYITLDGGFMLVVDGLQQFDANYMYPKVSRVVDVVQKVLGQVTIGSDDRVLYKKVKD